MITTGSKWFYGLGFVALAMAAAYGWTTGGNGLGPVTVGYKGGVGDHLGYGILLAAGLLSLGQGIVLTAWRDADPQAQAQLARVDALPTARPASISYWPAAAAFGAGLVCIGLVAGKPLFIAGAVVLGIVVVEWTVQTWADHATGDPATNRRIRNRLMNPIEFPVAGVLGAAIVVLSFSRLFLTSSRDAAPVAAAIGGSLVLIVGWTLAAGKKLTANIVVGIVLVLAVAVIGVGVASAVHGERTFHKAGTEGSGY
jgi:hypothetical protein